MTRTDHDDTRLLEHLVVRADHGMPDMRLDAVHVLAAARRHRTRIRATRALGASVAVVGVLLGGLQVAGPSLAARVTAAFSSETRDVSEGAAQSLELAPGVVATTKPAQRLLTDGTHAQVLGLLAGNSSTVGRELAVVPNDGVNRDGFEPAPWLDTTLELALLDATTLTQRQYWDRWAMVAPLTPLETAFWTRDGAPVPDVFDPRLTGGRPDNLPAGHGWAMSISFDDATWLVIGFAPLGTDPTALAQVTLRDPIPTADGTPTTTLELPTFEVGSADGRRMFAATIDPTVGLPTPDQGGTMVTERIPVALVTPASFTAGGAASPS